MKSFWKTYPFANFPGPRVLILSCSLLLFLILARVSENHISVGGAERFAEVLRSNPQLQRINLGCKLPFSIF